VSLPIRPGDILFTRQAEPAIVKERNPKTGLLNLDREEGHVRDLARHGYINGIDLDKRHELYAILDEVKGHTDDPAKRIELLQSRLATLEQDPKNLSVSRYLRSEITHLMNSYGIKPREYSIDSSKIRSL
jgi:hypothetical protein